MDEQQYMEWLYDVKVCTAEKRYDDAMNKLEELYKYKPVRLSWYLAKARLLDATGSPNEEIMKVLNDKFWPAGNEDNIKDYYALLTAISRGKEAKRNTIRRYYVSQKLLNPESGKDLDEKLKECLLLCSETIPEELPLGTLANLFYMTDDTAAFFIVMLEQIRRGEIPENKNGWFYKSVNYGYLQEKIQEKKANDFILTGDCFSEEYLKVVGYLIGKSNHNVYILQKPALLEEDLDISLLDTVEISLRSIEKRDGITFVPSVCMKKEGISVDNRAYLIDYICQELTKDRGVVLLSDTAFFDDMSVTPILRGNVHQLSTLPYDQDMYLHKLQFGWAGEYLAYISHIYGFDVEKRIVEKPEVKYSFVIPARNSAQTLRHTILTCLNQRNVDTFEILISDNSVEGYDDIRVLCNEWKEEKIRYIHTPRILDVSKSFEYAVLQAKGEFIIPVGSDDGVLPWALEVLEDIREKYPDELIINWKRGFYAWPGFNKGQENMFVIPNQYEKGEYGEHYVSGDEYIHLVLESESNIYLLPMLYINSGFHKRYLYKLLKKTKRLWDGWNQDAYMGIVNSCINEYILNLEYPLAIAGMSSMSLGFLNVSPDLKEKSEKMKQIMHQSSSIGEYTFSSFEKRIPTMSNDTSVLYNAVLRAVYLGIFPKRLEEKALDYKKIFYNCFRNMNTANGQMDCFLQQGLMKARKHGPAFENWYMDRIYIPLSQLRLGKEASDTTKKLYQEGREGNALILDASKWEVRNVDEAVKLFVKLTRL